MTRPEVLLFDLGGVLIENDTFAALQNLLPTKPDGEALRHRWLSSRAVREFELGRLAPEAFAVSFLAEWSLDLPPELFLDQFRSWPRGFFPGLRERLNRLRRRYRVGCLSNCNAVHWEKFGGFAQDFDIALSSHLLGAVKPDEEAFSRALAACGAPATAVRFFDDTEANVEAALQMGIPSFLVQGPLELLAALQTEGL